MVRIVDILDGENPKAVSCIAVFSVAFHVLVFIVVPIILSLHWKPRILSRPPTFELIQIQTPQPPKAQPAKPAVSKPQQTVESKPVETPKPQEVVTPKPSVEKKIEPKKEEVKPQPKTTETAKPTKPVEDDLSDFESMFAEPPASSSVSLQISEPFPYQWYLDQLQSRIKSRWKPSQNEKGEVVVQFTITRNGSMEGLKLVSSSGRAILDRQAIQTVEMSAPFASLPSGFQGQTLSVVLTLKPQK
jgi:TonB family protein